MRRAYSGLRRWFPVPTQAVGTIIAICVAVHVLVLILVYRFPYAAQLVLQNGALIPATVILKPWTILTMAFLHDINSIMHIVFNMIALASIGPWLEKVIGTRRFYWLYLISTVCGSVLFCLWQWVVGDPTTPAIGASGAIMGIVVGFGFVFPEVELRVMMVAPLKAKNIVWAAIAVDAVMYVLDVPIAFAVHGGGMIGAWLFFRRPWNRKYREWIILRISNKIKWLKARRRLRRINSQWQGSDKKSWDA